MWGVPLLFAGGVEKPTPNTLLLSSLAICKCEAPVFSCTSCVAVSSSSGTCFI